MFKEAWSQLFGRTYSPRAIRDSFFVHYREYLPSAEQKILEHAERCPTEFLEALLDDADQYFERIGGKETPTEQARALRRTLLVYRERLIRSQIYFDQRWAAAQRRRIGKHLLPEIDAAERSAQLSSDHFISSAASAVFLLVGKEFYEDENRWLKEYTEIFRSYVEMRIGISLEDDPAVRIQKLRSRMPIVDRLLAFQKEHIADS